MEFRRDDRGVTVQIGAILLFGILIIALATMQVTVVPDENGATEFEHNLEVQQSIGELRNALLAAGRSGDPAAVSIPLGTTYEQRTFFVNPPPVSGTIRTVGTGENWTNVTLANAHADSQYENANEYWNGTTRTYDTGNIVYTPSYSEYREAPTTVYEHSLVANVFSEDRTLERTGQTLIRGNRINLLTINGTLQENGVMSESIDARPLSAYTNTVTVRSGDDPLWINITSRLSATTWENRVLAEQTGSGGNVDAVVEISNESRGGVTYHRIGIKLESNTSYELRGSSVAVGAVSERTKQPKPTYLVVTDGYDRVGNGSTGNVTVQVRDQFNNPVDDFEVTGTLDTEHLQFVNESGNEVDSINVTTGEDGYATFTYKGVKPTGADTTWLNVSMLGGGETYQFRNFSERKVPVFAEEDSSDAVNPAGSGDVVLEDATFRTASSVDLTLNNTKSGSVDIRYVRVAFYDEGIEGYDLTRARLQQTGTEVADMEIGGDYVLLSPQITLPTGETTLQLQFEPSTNVKAKEQVDDMFVFTVIYEMEGEVERARYFVDGKPIQ